MSLYFHTFLLLCGVFYYFVKYRFSSGIAFLPYEGFL